MAVRTFKGKGFAARFDFDRLIEENVAGAKKGLKQAADFLVKTIKQDLSKPGPLPKTLKGKRRERQERLIEQSGETARASREGEPPRTRLGNLRASIDRESKDDGLTQRVGTSFKYGFWLEWGTVKMKPRPWLRPALRNNLDKITELITNGMRGG